MKKNVAIALLSVGLVLAVVRYLVERMMADTYYELLSEHETDTN